MTNTIDTMVGQRKITINRNEVRISATQRKIDSKEKEITCIKKTYQIVNVIDMGENHQLVKCLGQGEITIFSISQCCKICQVPQTAVVKYFIVCDELFVKIMDGEKESIYDESGTLIEADCRNCLEVVFGGCEPRVKKTSKRTGLSGLYTFEGCLVG